MPSALRYSPSRAILFISVGTGFLAATDISMKYLASSYSLPAILWVRNLMLISVIAALLLKRGEWNQTRTSLQPLQLVRGTVMGAAPLMFYIALMYMPVAEATAIFLLMPVMVALLAVPLLKEPADPRRLVAALIGFAGVLAIIRPGSDAFTPYTLVVLGAAILASGYQILTRKLAGQQGALASLFYPWVIGTLLCTPFAFYRWTPPETPAHWIMVFLIALSSLTGNVCIVRAYDYGHASLIAPFLYLQLFWAAVMGWLVLGDFPDAWSIAGMAAIVFAGLLLVQRRSLLRRQD